MSSSTKTRVGATSRKSPAHTGCYAKYRLVRVTYFPANMIIFPAPCKILIYIYIYMVKGHPATGRGGPRGSGKIKAPDFLDVWHYKGGWLSAIRTSRLYPRRNPWYSLSDAESTSGHMVLSGGATGKIPSDTTGNRSRDRLNSSAVP